MESEKVKEIKELLRCMNGEKACTNCYINDIAQEQETYCINIVADMTLNLINDLESENAYKQEHIELWFRKNEEKKKRIAELEKGNEALSFAVKQGFNDCQTKTLKQFAERLKEKFYYEGRICRYIIDSDVFDETLNEFCQETQQKEREND